MLPRLLPSLLAGLGGGVMPCLPGHACLLRASTPCAFLLLACTCAPFVWGCHAGDSIPMRAHLVTLHAGVERLRNTTLAPTCSFYQYPYLPYSTKTLGKLRGAAAVTAGAPWPLSLVWRPRELAPAGVGRR